mgnify:CR=1 FL=1
MTENTLFSCDADGSALQEWNFDGNISAAGVVNDETLMLATETGLWHFNIADGAMAEICPLEESNEVTRSNDGRADRHGGFWIGTMGKSAEDKAGSIYRYYNGNLKKLLEDVTIPNSICFSPDGAFAYYTDTVKNVIMRWTLDDHGNPTGSAEPFIDHAGADFGIDGSIVDSEGNVWNAQWGASRVARYTPDGTFDMAVSLPVPHVTCPCFGGPDLRTLFVTTAKQGLTASQRAEYPDSGGVFSFEIDVAGLPDGIVQLA